MAALAALVTTLCCVGLPALVGFISALGAGFLLRDSYLEPSLSGTLLLAVLIAGLHLRRHHQPGPFLLSLVAAGSMFFAIYGIGLLLHVSGGDHMAATPAWSPYLAYGAIPVLLGAQAWDRLRSTGAARAGPRLFLRLPRSLRTCLCTTYGWDDPIAIVNDIEADVQQALRNHEQAGRAGAIKVFRRAVSWMRIRAEELRQALR